MRSLNKGERAIIFLDSFEKLEYKHKKGLLDFLDGPEDIFENPQRVYDYFEGVGDSNAAKTICIAIENKEVIEEFIEGSLKFADDIVTIYSADYPQDLLNTPAPPIALYCRGNLGLLNSPNKIGVVGSRKTLLQYSAKAKEICAELSSEGVVVVTGIADGADMSAIDGAIASGNIISVLPGGLDCVYPKYNASLIDEVAKVGLVISEHRAGIVPKFYMFPVRNRIIAGLTSGVLIVSGSYRSGARHTAGYAADYGREVFCLPYGLGVSSGELCKSLIKNGATMVESGQEIAEAIGVEMPQKESQLELSEDEKSLYKLIKEKNYDTDGLVEATGKQIYEIISVLSMLELKGLIVKSGLYYSPLK